jgi:hypothetical protein
MRQLGDVEIGHRCHNRRDFWINPVDNAHH